MATKDKTVHKRKDTKQDSTQKFLTIAEIRDGTLVLKSGGIRSIMKVSSVNFNLKSAEEQNALIYAYQGFLNTLDFPVQIVIRSRKLDIDVYVEKLVHIAKGQKNPLLRKQTTEYIEYIKKLVEYADIMEKSFYVVIPHDPARAENVSGFQRFLKALSPQDSLEAIRARHKEFEKLRKKLSQRVSVAKAGLEGCGLTAEELTTNEIIQLFYQIYNPSTSRHQKLEDASGQHVIPM